MGVRYQLIRNPYKPTHIIGSELKIAKCYCGTNILGADNCSIPDKESNFSAFTSVHLKLQIQVRKNY